MDLKEAHVGAYAAFKQLWLWPSRCGIAARANQEGVTPNSAHKVVSLPPVDHVYIEFELIDLLGGLERIVIQLHRGTAATVPGTKEESRQVLIPHGACLRFIGIMN